MSAVSVRRRRGALVVVLLAVLSSGCARTIPGSASPAELAAPPLTTSARPAPSATPTAAPTGSPGVVPLVIDPVVPGWNVVRSVNRAAVYDVPPTWTVLSEDTVIGFEDTAGNRVVSSGAATFGEDVCGDNSNLGIAVVRHDEGTDLAAASRINAEQWADLAYRDAADARPALSTAAPEKITTIAGQEATVVKVTATPSTPVSDCAITTGSTWAVAATGFTGELGPTVVLLLVADVGVPDAVPEAEIRQILSSLRPAA